jgi:nuclear pore complex protein Nup160
LTKNIPDEKYHLSCRDTEVVDLADLRHEYTLVNSRLELVKRQPDLLAASRKCFLSHASEDRHSCQAEHFLSGSQIVSAYAQAGSYDYAMSAARSLGVDMTELFERLTIQCLRLKRRGETAL